MSPLPTIPVRMTVAEFFARNPLSAQHWQLVGGQSQAMATANRTHRSVQAELCSLIRNRLEAHASPCSVITTPGVIPCVQAETNVRIPLANSEISGSVASIAGTQDSEVRPAPAAEALIDGQ
jgi:hypothetical protein